MSAMCLSTEAGYIAKPHLMLPGVDSLVEEKGCHTTKHSYFVIFEGSRIPKLNGG
jgi:hypothetical protein